MFRYMLNLLLTTNSNSFYLSKRVVRTRAFNTLHDIWEIKSAFGKYITRTVSKDSGNKRILVKVWCTRYFGDRWITCFSSFDIRSVSKFRAPGVAVRVARNECNTARQLSSRLLWERFVAPEEASMVSYLVGSSSFSPSCCENWRVSNFEIQTAAKTALYKSYTVDYTPVTRKVLERTPRNQAEKNFAWIVKVDPVLSTRNPIGKEQLLHRNFPRFRYFERYVDLQLHTYKLPRSRL